VIRSAARVPWLVGLCSGGGDPGAGVGGLDQHAGHVLPLADGGGGAGADRGELSAPGRVRRQPEGLVRGLGILIVCPAALL